MMNNNEINNEKNTLPEEEKSLFSVEVRQNTRRKKKKRSLFKAQLRMLVTIGVFIVLLSVAVGLCMHFFSRTDGIVDTFKESRTDTENGKVTYTYYSKADGSGYTITDVDGNKLESMLVDENGNITTAGSENATLVFETELGSLLQLTSAGKINYYAIVDYNGSYVGGDAGCRVLMFPHTNQEEIKRLKIHHGNKDGSVTEFNVNGSDSNGDGYIDLFKIEGYEDATMNQLLSASMCSFAGYTLTLKKLSTAVMDVIDKENLDKDDYAPLRDENGQINFAEYGLELSDELAYYEITTMSGETYRVYMGSDCPDGSGMYVRYYDEKEGHRNAVYKLSDDPGASAALGVSISRKTLLRGQPEDLVYPQIVFAGSMNTYLMADGFKILGLEESGYKSIIDFSYVDLALRNFTIDRSYPYIMNDDSLLSGYRIDDNVVDRVLQSFYEIAGIMSDDYGTSSVKNYVAVRKLVKKAINASELPNMSDYTNYNKYYKAWSEAIVKAVDASVENDTELRDALKQYGLDKPYRKIYYNSSEYSGSMLYLASPNYIWISERTDNATYYVWAPLYQQIVEIGEQYLDIIERETLEWASEEVFGADIVYCDSIRINGMYSEKDENGDLRDVYKDILFELDSSYGLTWQSNFICSYGMQADISSSKFNITVNKGVDGTEKLSLTAALKYTIQYKDSSTGELTSGTENHNIDLISNLNIETVKNYCRYLLDNSYVNKLSEEQIDAINAYVKNAILPAYPPVIAGDRSTVTITHRIKDAGDSYGYIDASTYVINFVYDVEEDNLTMIAKHDGSVASFLYDEEVVRNYFLLKVDNGGNIPQFSEEELAEIDSLYKQVSAFTSVQEVLRIKEFDRDGNIISEKTYTYDKNNKEAEGTLYMSSFKQFYKTLLFSTYEGRADVSETVGGGVLTREEMDAYRAKGDDCDLKITVKLGLDGIEYEYRMYNYSATKSYITVNGEGLFYILRSRTNKFINDAVRATFGDQTIVGDNPY